MATDLSVLKAAAAFEALNPVRAWGTFDIHASRQDVNRLLDNGYIERRHAASRIGPNQFGPALYKLTEKGRQVLEDKPEIPRPSVEEILKAMDYIVGFSDLKLEIARAIAFKKRTHFLLEGPPASVKTTLLLAIAEIIPDDAELINGMGSSAKGVANKLFDKRPSILLIDEIDKMKREVREMLLTVLETGEIKETKADADRGIVLDTLAFAACNRSDMFSPEQLSRFLWHPHFKPYTRPEFLAVGHTILCLKKGCPADVAEYISSKVFDYHLGDVRQVRGIFDAMTGEPTIEEADRLIAIKLAYLPEQHPVTKRKSLSMF